MKTEEIPLDNIVIPSRLRGVDAARVDVLAESIERIGLQTPPTVWAEAGGNIYLVAGAHRIEALRKLGAEWVDVFVTDASEIDRQLWEIDENLIRSELTATEQAEHLLKRKEIWEVQQSGQTSPTSNGRKGFAQSTSEATGTPKRTINQSISRAENIPDDVLEMIRGTKFDTGVYLDKLKSLSEEDQRAKVVVDLESLVRNLPRAPKPPPGDEETDAKDLAHLFKRWREASREVQERFIDALRDEGRIE